MRVIAFCLRALALALPAHSATIHVPADYATIHEALEVAVSGDSVLVGPGTYTATVSRMFHFVGPPPATVTLTTIGFLPAGVTLLAPDGPNATTLEITGGAHSHCLVGAQVGSGDANEVCGFRFRRVGGGAAAFFVREMPDGWSLRLEDCVFESMQGGMEEAGGLWAFDGGDLEIANCEFDDVDSERGFGAVGTLQNHVLRHSLTVAQCSFRGCDGRGIHSWAIDFAVSDCSFDDCTTDRPEGGSAIRSASVNNTVEDCVFTNCSNTPLVAATGTFPTVTEIRRCVFLNGTGSSCGGASCSAWDILVEDCWFEGCSGTAVGALRLGSTGSIEAHVRRNVFVEIQAETFGALYWARVHGSITNNTFVDCFASSPSGGAGVYVTTTSFAPTELDRNIFTGCGGGVAARHSLASSGELFESCNCYWDNAGGHVDGFPMDATSFVANPLFCDPQNGDYTLAADSPCLPGNHPTGWDCGLIGAFGRGCGPVALTPQTWARVKTRYR